MKYRISANSFHGNHSFLNLTLCTVTFDHSAETIQGRKLFKGGNYSRAETIRGNTVSPNYIFFLAMLLNYTWRI